MSEENKKLKADLYQLRTRYKIRGHLITEESKRNAELESELTAAKAENEAVRLANLDVMNHYDDARAEIERLRGRVGELESRASDVVELFDRITGEIDYDVYELFQAAIEPLRDIPKNSQSWLLRKQAEAVKSINERYELCYALPQKIKGKRFKEGYDTAQTRIRREVRAYAERLRQQADELDND